MPDTVAGPANPQLSPLGRFERFLVATDGSEYSAGAVREAFNMAQKCGARVHVITVVSGDAEYESLGEQLFKKELDAAQAHLDRVRTQATAAGVACETQVVQGGNLHQEIVNAAERTCADLIVVGRRGRHRFARFMVGDTTIKVIGHARCSVLVVPRVAELTGRHFVVASDGSRFGDAAALVAGNLARLSRTPVTVVSVTMPTHSDERRREAQYIVQRLAAFLRKEGVTADSEVPHGRPDAMIVDTARRKQADRVVMGSHGRTGLERILLGSTAERVINETPCAVLVVNPA